MLFSGADNECGDTSVLFSDQLPGENGVIMDVLCKALLRYLCQDQSVRR
jgi:hypothetical protein